MSELVLGIALFIEVVSSGVRFLVPLHAHWWVVPGHLYLGHIQHVNSMSGGFVASLVASILFLAAALKLNGASAGQSRWTRLAVVCLALGLAGGLANAYELLAFGSATDFLGVRTSGMYSANVYDLADLALYVGSFGRLLLIFGAVGRAFNRRRRIAERAWNGVA